MRQPITILLCVTLLVGAAWWLFTARDNSWQHIEGVESLAFQSDGRSVVVIRESDIATFAWPELREQRTFAPPRDPGIVTLSGDGKWIAIYGIYTPCIEIWNVELVQRTACVPHAAVRIDQVFLSRDGTVLLIKQAQDSSGFRLWQLRNGEVSAELPTPSGIQGFVALSADGQLFAYTSDSTIEIVRVQDTTVIQSLVLPQSGGAGGMTFSNDGQLLAVAGRGARELGFPDIWIWNLADGQLTDTLVGYKDVVRSIAFSADNAYIAAGGGDTEPGALNDSSVKVWRRSDDQLLHTFNGARIVGQVTFSLDRRAVGASTYRGDTAYFWHMP